MKRNSQIACSIVGALLIFSLLLQSGKGENSRPTLTSLSARALQIGLARTSLGFLLPPRANAEITIILGIGLSVATNAAAAMAAWGLIRSLVQSHRERHITLSERDLDCNNGVYRLKGKPVEAVLLKGAGVEGRGCSSQNSTALLNHIGNKYNEAVSGR